MVGETRAVPLTAFAGGFSFKRIEPAKGAILFCDDILPVNVSGKEAVDVHSSEMDLRRLTW